MMNKIAARRSREWEVSSVNWKLAALMGILVSTAPAGCSVSARTTSSLQTSARNILFNPEWTGLPVSSVTRTDWPSTVAFSSLYEGVEYRETILDRQGGFGSDRDYLYRRFYSVRTGRARR